MIIKGSNEVATHVDRATSAEIKRKDSKLSTGKGSGEQTGEGAIVNLSERSKDIQTVQRVLQSQPEIRLDKVKVIKEKIEKGTYEIDFEGLADKILKSSLEDMP